MNAPALAVAGLLARALLFWVRALRHRPAHAGEPREVAGLAPPVAGLVAAHSVGAESAEATPAVITLRPKEAHTGPAPVADLSAGALVPEVLPPRHERADPEGAGYAARVAAVFADLLAADAVHAEVAQAVLPAPAALSVRGDAAAPSVADRRP